MLLHQYDSRKFLLFTKLILLTGEVKTKTGMFTLLKNKAKETMFHLNATCFIIYDFFPKLEL